MRKTDQTDRRAHAARSKQRFARMLRITAKAGISILLIWLVFRHQDVRALMDRMRMVNYSALAVGAGIFGCLTLSLALRWSAILGALGYVSGPRFTFPLVLIGQFFNQALPSAVGGDALRVWLAYRSGLPGIVAIASVVLDRLLGILALLLLVTAAFPEVSALTRNPIVPNSFALVLCAGYGGFIVLALADRLPGRFGKLKVVRMVAQLAGDLRAVLKSPRAAPAVLFYGLLNQVGSALVVFVLAHGIGLNVSLSACLLIVPLANLVQVAPISIAGWGVRETFFVVAFGMVGVAATQALALSITYGLLYALISLPGGVVWLAYGRARPGLVVAGEGSSPQVESRGT